MRSTTSQSSALAYPLEGRHPGPIVGLLDLADEGCVALHGFGERRMRQPFRLANFPDAVFQHLPLELRGLDEGLWGLALDKLEALERPDVLDEIEEDLPVRLPDSDDGLAAILAPSDKGWQRQGVEGPVNHFALRLVEADVLRGLGHRRRGRTPGLGLDSHALISSLLFLAGAGMGDDDGALLVVHHPLDPPVVGEVAPIPVFGDGVKPPQGRAGVGLEPLGELVILFHDALGQPPYWYWVALPGGGISPHIVPQNEFI